MMSNLTHQFTNVVTMAKCIEQGIRMIKFLCPLRKKGFRRKKKDVDHIKGGYKGKKNHFLNYNPPFFSS